MVKLELWEARHEIRVLWKEGSHIATEPRDEADNGRGGD